MNAFSILEEECCFSTLIVFSMIFKFALRDLENNGMRKFGKNKALGTSLVAQWLRIHLPMQGTWVRALVWEDPMRSK